MVLGTEKSNFENQDWLCFHIWFITKVYHKMPQVFILQNATVLLQNALISLQNATTITKCNVYCKMHRYTVKEKFELILPAPTQNFNFCIHKNRFANRLKQTDTTSLHERGDSNDMNNYRAASTLQSSSKVFEKIPRIKYDWQDIIKKWRHNLERGGVSGTFYYLICSRKVLSVSLNRTWPFVYKTPSIWFLVSIIKTDS